MKVLEVGGVPVTIIAEKCGTPVYIYDEAKIEKQIEDYKKFFVSRIFYNPSGLEKTPSPAFKTDR